MAITSYKAVVGYYNSAGTPSITTAVTGQLSDGWIPIGSPILTDAYGQCAQMMAKTDATPVIATSAYTVVTAANPQPPDATWDAQGEPLWIDTTTYLQAYTKGGAYLQGAVNLASNQVTGVLPVSKGGTGSDNAGGARINLNLERFVQSPGETQVIAPGNTSYLTVSDTIWGVFDLTAGSWRPLGINQGGTGATTSEAARTNLGLGTVATLNNVPVANGGTGATTAAAARTNLGLGTVATFNTVPVANGGTGATTVDGARGSFRISQQSGQYGSINNLLTVFNNALPSGGVISFRDEAVDAAATYQFGASLLSRVSDTYATFSVNHLNGNLRVSGGGVSGGIASTNYINNIWGTRNTTVDANGFIKQASPIVKIFSDGKSDVNIDAEGVTVTRLSEGVYRLTGCLGLNSDSAWGGPDGGFEIPVDKNKQPRVWLDYDVDVDGSITVRTYHREHPDAPVFAQNKIDGYTNGQPVDIPAGTFVSVRVNMPHSGK